MTRAPVSLTFSIVCCLLVASVGSALGQGGVPRRDRGPFPPLQYETTDYWAEVHRWTGSEATRPRSQGPGARPGTAAPIVTPAPDGSPTVTTSATARANIRSAPDLSAPVVRSMPRRSVLRVFGEAPGGWFHVGVTEPFGWVNAAALQR